MDDMFVKPGNQERGWNDPPQFSYGLQMTPSSTKHAQLSKRPPPAGGAGHQTPPICGITPPLAQQIPPICGITPPLAQQIPPICGITPPPPRKDPSCSILPPPCKQDPVVHQSALVGIQSEMEPDVEAVLSVLQGLLAACRHVVSSQVCDDIAKRLRLLDNSWRSGKLSSTVKRRMHTLTLEMKSSRWDSADHIHRSLMVDHVTEVSQWMVGVKRLIAEIRNLQPELLLSGEGQPVQG